MTLKGLILVVDDDPSVATALAGELGRAGLTLRPLSALGAARQVCSEERVAGIVTEYRLPDGEIPAFCQWLRHRSGENGEAPLLVLARESTETERVAALQAGADDFVAKPFHVREVLLRLRRWLRPGPDFDPDPTFCRVGHGMLDRHARILTLGGHEVGLTRKEYELLCALLERRGAVVSREDLRNMIWGREEPLSPRAVDTNVQRLRRKLGRSGPLLQTVRGFGYRLRDQP